MHVFFFGILFAMLFEIKLRNWIGDIEEVTAHQKKPPTIVHILTCKLFLN